MIYVSSKLRHRDIWASSKLPIISTWIHGKELPPEECSDMWDRYREEISRASAFLIYLEPEDRPKGCLLELGIALQAKIPIVIVWAGPIPDLVSALGTVVYHNSVTVVPSIKEAELNLLSLPSMQ